MVDRSTSRRTGLATLTSLLTALLAAAFLGGVAPSAGADEPSGGSAGAGSPPVRSAPVGAAGSAYVQARFAEGSNVDLVGGRLASRSPDGAALQRVLDRSSVAAVSRLFTQSAGSLRADLASLRARAGAAGTGVPALDKWYRIQAASPEAAADLATALSALDIVEAATAIPAPPLPPATPNLVGLQGYRNPAPDGIGATAVAGIAGATGSRVKVVDLEYSWNLQHEDLPSAAGSLVPNGTPCDPFFETHHGTAVLGELVGAPNAYGVTGLVPDATLATVNVANLVGGDCLWDLPDAINIARGVMARGDVMLLEQQIPGPNGAYIPVEWDPAVYDAIVTATAAGIIVVEAAGNGAQNLNNSTLFGAPFPGGRPSSGAIIVGAGGAPSCSLTPRSRLSLSTYGARVDLQGWGECVTTTGYGDAFGATPNNLYTNFFGGTSSASPIVAAAAAAVSSVTEARTGLAPTPAQVRQTLIATGTPQATGSGVLSGHVGPLPNLVAALGTGQTLPGAPLIGAATPGTAGGAITALATWRPPASDGSAAITGYRVRGLRMSATGTVLSTTVSPVQPASARSLSMTLPRAGQYRFTVQAINSVGAGPQSARSNKVAGR